MKTYTIGQGQKLLVQLMLFNPVDKPLPNPIDVTVTYI
jgi:hypothetical protein